MRLKAGSDWLRSQEELAYGQIYELQPPLKIVTKTVERRVGHLHTDMKRSRQFFFGILFLLFLILSIQAFSLQFSIFGFLVLVLLYALSFYANEARYVKQIITQEKSQTFKQKHKPDATLSEWQARLENIRSVRQAQDKTCNILAFLLDDNWVLYRNLILPDGRHDEIDAVVVGPTGIFCLQIKAYSGLHRHSGDTWQVAIGSGAWQKKECHPAWQASVAGERLGQFLSSQGIGGICVHSRLVWAGTGRLEIIGQPLVPIWFLSRTNSSDSIRRDLFSDHSRLSYQDALAIDRVLG